jgi:hypothetical protein
MDTSLHAIQPFVDSLHPQSPNNGVRGVGVKARLKLRTQIASDGWEVLHARLSNETSFDTYASLAGFHRLEQTIYDQLLK